MVRESRILRIYDIYRPAHIDTHATERMRAGLPVVALGMKIGVDYGIHVYGRLRTHLSQRLDLNYGSKP